jgi:DNA polymerase III subunit beta
MQFLAERSTLNQALALAVESTGKGQMSILQTVLLELSDNTLTLRSTDLKTSLMTKVQVEGREDGKLAVFADKLSAILSGLPDGPVDFAYVDGVFKVKPKTKKATYKLPVMQAQNFPDFPEFDESASFEITGAELLAAVQKSAFAVSQDETRFFMNGLYLTNDNGLKLVATDGRRLAVAKLLDKVIDLTGSIVTVKPLLLLAKRTGPADVVTVSLGAKQVKFTAPNFTIWGSLIEGQFPNYKKVIPSDCKNTLTLDRSELEQALKRVAILTDGLAKKITIDVKLDKILVKSVENNLGEAVEEVEAVATAENQFCFNYTFLTDAIKGGKGELVMQYNEAGHPFKIEEDGNLQVIMPMSAE